VVLAKSKLRQLEQRSSTIGTGAGQEMRGAHAHSQLQAFRRRSYQFNLPGLLVRDEMGREQ